MCDNVTLRYNWNTYLFNPSINSYFILYKYKLYIKTSKLVNICSLNPQTFNCIKFAGLNRFSTPLIRK